MQYWLIDNLTHRVMETRRIFENNGRLKFVIEKAPIREGKRWIKFAPRFLESEIEIYSIPEGYSLTPID